MIEREILELINAEIDGINTPQDSARLRSHLQRSVEAKGFYEDLERIAKAMRTAGFAEPAPGALERVLATIPFQAPRPRPDYGGGFSHWIANMFRRPSVRFASAFAMGAVVTAVLLVSVSREVDRPFSRPLDISDISGTISTIDAASQLALVGSVDAQLSTVDASLRLVLHANDDLLVAGLDLLSSKAIECVLSYDGADVSFDGFRRVSGSSEAVDAGRSETRITQRGDGHYLLFFSRSSDTPPSMTIRIYVAEELVFEEMATVRSQE